MPSVHHVRRPRASPLWQIVHHVWDDFLTGYEKHHRRTMGPLRPDIREWIPDDDAEQEFDLFDQRPESGKPVEIPREDGTILVLDGD